jgi:hypothetical protein
MLYTLQNDLYDCHLVCTCTMAYKQEAAKDTLCYLLTLKTRLALEKCNQDKNLDSINIHTF